MAALLAAGPSDREVDRAALLAHHTASLRAHLERDAAWFARERGDEFTVVSAGEIARPTRAETEAFFRRYLERTRFTEYRDLVPPVVRVSDDGTLGWVIVQIKARGVQTTDTGEERPLEFVSAWVALYEKRGGRWLSAGNASSFRP